MTNKPAELQLVGRTGDGSAIELTDVSGAKFSLPITETLKTALTQPRLVSVAPIDERPSFGVKEIQARLRAGESIEAAQERWRAPQNEASKQEQDAAYSLLSRSPRQLALYTLLLNNGPAPTADILTAGFGRPMLRKLQERGLAECLWEQPAARGAFDPNNSLGDSQGPPLTLNADQSGAVAAITAKPTTFDCFLLDGVTGSGKTEVYMRAMAQQLSLGRQCLVLIPEIGLTPQTIARFTERFRCPVVALHSSLNESERLSAWARARDGSAGVVIGTRSALFTPLAKPGILIIDEEHDSSFKQQDGFRYSARDLAVMRAHAEGMPIVLGSATPSLETLHNALVGKFRHLRLPHSTAVMPRAAIELVDVSEKPLQEGFSEAALTRLKQHLDNGNQCLVFINRRGYAPVLNCTTCGWSSECNDCIAQMTVHRTPPRLRCHHCGADRELPRQCPQCGYAVKTVGQGTERIEESLAETFQGIGIARLDRDVVRRQDELEAVVSRITSGDARILVGTQMIAKGHDFPDVTLVVVLNADQGLFSTDFRAAERLAQTIVQVAGRAGRGDRRGEVLIQTEYPEHPLLRGLLEGGYEAFASAALAERESAAWPPFARLAALRASALQADWATDFLAAARRAAPKANVRLLGPAPAAMAKRAGRFHAQLLIESGERAALHRFLDRWVPAVEALPEVRRVRWALDVDPLELF